MTIEKPKNPKDRIILALDVDDFDEAKKDVMPFIKNKSTVQGQF